MSDIEELKNRIKKLEEKQEKLTNQVFYASGLSFLGGMLAGFTIAKFTMNPGPEPQIPAARAPRGPV